MAPARLTMAGARSITSMSRSVARKLTWSPSASISTFDEDRDGVAPLDHRLRPAHGPEKGAALHAEFHAVTVARDPSPRSRPVARTVTLRDLRGKGKRLLQPERSAATRPSCQQRCRRDVDRSDPGDCRLPKLMATLRSLRRRSTLAARQRSSDLDRDRSSEPVAEPGSDADTARLRRAESVSARDVAAIGRPALLRRRSGLEHPAQELDVLGDLAVGGAQLLDLAHGVDHRGVVAAAEAAADVGRASARSASWRGTSPPAAAGPPAAPAAPTAGRTSAGCSGRRPCA